MNSTSFDQYETAWKEQGDATTSDSTEHQVMVNGASREEASMEEHQ